MNGTVVRYNHASSFIADFGQLSGRLVVFRLFFGAFWSVKFIETSFFSNLFV